jgi:hypothetical protein
VIRALGYVVTSLETPLPSRAPAVCWAWEWGGAGLGMLQSVVQHGVCARNTVSFRRTECLLQHS